VFGSAVHHLAKLVRFSLADWQGTGWSRWTNSLGLVRSSLRQLKAAAGRGSRVDKEDEEGAVLAKIAEMPGRDRVMGKGLHAVVKASAPALSPRLWYGMPVHAQDGQVVCFFQNAQKFETRYATLGFSFSGGRIAPVQVVSCPRQPFDPGTIRVHEEVSGMTRWGRACAAIVAVEEEPTRRQPQQDVLR
jgi:hypothetical protein